jgi:hypothetical protein
VTQTNAVKPLHVHTIDPKKDIKLCFWQLEANLAHGRYNFGVEFCGKIWEAQKNLFQEPASEGNVTQINVTKPLHVHTIDLKKDIKLCYWQMEANLAHGRQISHVRCIS